MGFDPFFPGSAILIPILYLFSYAILFPIPILNSLPDPFPILILSFLPDPDIILYLINTNLFHNSKQYICRYNTYVIPNLNC